MATRRKRTGMRMTQYNRKKKNSNRRGRYNLVNKRRKRRHKRKRTQRGGWSQFAGNEARSMSYSQGGVLTPKHLGLANPPPFYAYKKCSA